MSTPAPGQRFAPCKCSHTKEQHDALAPQCSAPACTCLSYRPNLDAQQRPSTAPAGLASTPPAGPSRPLHSVGAAPVQTVFGTGVATAELIAASRRSTSKRTVALGGKLHDLVNELRDRLTSERDAAQAKARAEQAKADAQRLAEQAREAARREVAELEEKLKAARQRLKSTPATGFTNGRTPPAPKTSTKPARTGTAVCPDCGKDGLSNLGAHRSRAHGYRAEA